MHKFITRKRSFLRESNDVGKPGGITARGRLFKDEVFRVFLKYPLPCQKIFLAAEDKTLKFIHLRASYSGLHIGHFQIIPKFGIHILMIIAARQAAELLREAFSAGVILPAVAITIAAPIPQRSHDTRKLFIVCHNRAALPGCDMMRGIE